MLRATFVAAAFLWACSGSAHAAGLAQRLETLAEAGNAEAHYHLGMLYNNGMGVKQDPRRAFEHFRKAAAAGDPLGAYKVGCYYAGQFGDVVPADEAQALGYKLVAAKAGYRLAQLDVGVIHARRKDYGAALAWFEAASRQGDPQALYNLSVIHKEGLGTGQSPARAHAFFRLAHLTAKRKLSGPAQQQLDQIAAAMSAAEKAEAARLEREWIAGPTPLTVKAMAGVGRAEMLLKETRR